ncbi:HNH endonuclease [Streptomyces sp. XY431]|uniref:HNH endonuclease n=1 Tax=Streptomyces sp. XY431 TaxID=1415562 RepID=UPI000ABC3CD5|nr:HNH endonuclease [Streptomyces sp. XY431]
MSPSRSRAEIPWAVLIEHGPTRERYAERTFRRGPTQCWYWTGAISSSGHGKLRAGRSPDSEVVSAHEYGYGIEFGLEVLISTVVIRHKCDSPSCQNPAHWLSGTRQDNVLDYVSRSRIAGHALADTRGPAGRARAIRDAIKAAAPEDVEAAIQKAIMAGQPGGAWQDELFSDELL